MIRFLFNDSWSFLDRFLWCHLKCIVWVLSLFLGSIDAGTWRGYRLYGPRMGPIDNFSLVTGSAVNDVMQSNVVNLLLLHAWCVRSITQWIASCLPLLWTRSSQGGKPVSNAWILLNAALPQTLVISQCCTWHRAFRQFLIYDADCCHYSN